MVKVIANRVSLLDATHRVTEELEFHAVYRASKPYSLYVECLEKHTGAMLEGRNVTVFSLGSKASHHRNTVQGYGSEQGVASLFVEGLEARLADKKEQGSRGLISGFSYELLTSYYEIIDEEVYDLLTPNRFNSHGLSVEDDCWQGVRVDGLVTLEDRQARPILEKLRLGQKSMDRSVDERGSKNERSASVLSLQLVQHSLDALGSPDIRASTVRFVELPALDLLLADQENMRLNDERGGLTLARFQTVLAELSRSQEVSPVYESSRLTHLLREVIGGNSEALYILHLVPAEQLCNQLVLRLGRLILGVGQHPVANTAGAIGFHHKLRLEHAGRKDFKYAEVEGERKGIEESLRRIRSEDDYKRILEKYSELKGSHSDILKKKNDLESQFIKVSEQNITLSKTILDVQIEKADLMEQLKLKEYELGRQLMTAEAKVIEKAERSDEATKMLGRRETLLKEL